MEKSFDFGALLKSRELKHKGRPSQFVSVAGGTKKRVENITKRRRSSRFTIFDSIRNLPQINQCESPAPISEAKQKVEHRRQQLEKWKEEKEKKKKELATLKKKPFVAGVPKKPLNYLPPPPPKPVPSTSGRVTRSQSAKNKNEPKQTKPQQPESFAPKNATFRAPQIKTLTKMPDLVLPKTRKERNTIINFEPVLPKAQTDVKHTKRLPNQSGVNTRITRSMAMDAKMNGKIAKPVQKAPPKYIQSSSSSENEQSMQSASSSEVDVTAKMITSSSDNSSEKIHNSSTENESIKSLQSSSSSELETAEKNSEKLTNKSRKSMEQLAKAKTSRKSSTPIKITRQSNVVGSPKNVVPNSESKSEEKLRSPKSPADVSMTSLDQDNKISPCVTISRGKTNARKEMMMKLDEGLLDEDTSNVEVDHFRRQLSSEIKRMTEMCETWDKIYEQVVLPENVQELVRGAVGQARLLMSRKLAQFADLVERAARPLPGQPLVTPADLHGFWDMVFMQVENVDMRFKELEKLKARNWAAESPPPAAPRLRAAARPATKSRPAGQSRLKEMIAAARKAKQEQPPSAPEDKTFDAGFFCVRSPARSPTPVRSPCTPSNKHTLLKAVLSSEAKKASASKNSASFAMLRASVLSKNIDCDGVALLPQTPVPQVNLGATPGRSILKQSQDIKKSCNSTTKSVKMVLFDQSFTELDNSTSPKNTQEDIKTEKELIVPLIDVGTDSAQKDKENSRRRSKLIRQDATNSFEYTPMETRSRRKSKQTPQAEVTPQRRSGRKKILEEVETNVEEKKTPRRSTRSRKSNQYEDAVSAI